MGLLHKDVFVCIDCETTGLEAKTDRIIEIAVVKFTLEKIIDRYETLIDPEIAISESSMAIHHISQDMVEGKPKIQEVLPEIFQRAKGHILVGHGIKLDIDFVAESASRFHIANGIKSQPIVDTLRLARLYGQSPVNSLERLRQHFNIEEEGAHRAMNDVMVNIEVFKYLSHSFKTTEEMMARLSKPILLKTMPLGKHKGRPFSEVPTEYLQWAINKGFDEDLSFSLKTELKKRKTGKNFGQFINPFSEL